MNRLSFLLVIAIRAQAAPAATAVSSVYDCQGSSQEIKAIRDADQLDRSQPMTLMDQKDKKRRERIAEIFADGCFKTADDYANAALVFQHGEVPDHFFQAYLWSARAVELGDDRAETLMAAALDRYLKNKGYKQIYATQANILPETHGCWCLWPVEASSTDEDRRKLGRDPLADQMKWVDKLNSGNPSCGSAALCPVEAKPVPKGSLPGVAW
jgi:hypothetical protein